MMPAVTPKSTSFLHLALLGDAAATGASGLLLAPATGTLALLLLNLLWPVDSLLLFIWGPASLTAPGVGFVLAQVLVVLGFAVAQWTALRRTGAGAPLVLA